MENTTTATTTSDHLMNGISAVRVNRRQVGYVWQEEDGTWGACDFDAQRLSATFPTRRAASLALAEVA